MSIPQSHSTQTTEQPAVDQDRPRLTLVAPLTAVSQGNVTIRSTSSGAIPLASVMTTTVGAFRSGKTSTSILYATYTPASVNRSEPKRTANLLLRENKMILFSITYPP